MRQIAGLLMLIAPLSCSYDARWRSSCDISFSLICARQVECGQSLEQSQCEQDLRAQLFCDPSADLDDLKACRQAASQAGCEEAVPEVCLDAMCDTTAGCKDALNNTDPPCGPNGLTIEGQNTCDDGGGGGTGDTGTY
jgi:hypothetical protein